MYKPELLAPAGSWEALVAAVQNGADAVYLGGKAFNARQSAANFDDELLAKAVDYCHVRGVKVFVTVNIIIAENELSEALDFLYHLHNIGVDAVIVQDLGLARLARQVLPELPLHASTQMTVHNTAGVELLQQSGFERIVLSREMDLEGIRKVKEHTGAELEVFIHGALCICYSGQCLMSSLIGGRSGNRGRCAQPCRLQYQLVGKDGKPLVNPAKAGEYLLSPRDLNLSNHIPDLIKAGINSFKIEGRMKRPEYVATVIRIYRHLIDQALSGEEYGVDATLARELTQIFNRDFSTGYFYGNPGIDLMSYKRPNNRGVLLGRVKRFSKDSDLVELALQEPLRVGDGIEVWVTQGGRVGVEVPFIIVKGRRVESAAAGSDVWIPVRGKVRPGDRVFKTHDAELMERARASYSSSKEICSIPLKFTVQAQEGQPLYLRVEDPEGFTAEGYSQTVGQRAEKRPLTEEFLAKQLNRLGNTPFALDRLQCKISGDVMYPVRVINELRRSVLEDLERHRSAAFSREKLSPQVFSGRVKESMAELDKAQPLPQGKPKLAVNVTQLAAVKAVVDAGAQVVYFGGESYRSAKPVTPQQVQQAADYCHQRGVELVLSTPRILQDDELQSFNRFLEQVLSQVQGVLVGNLGLLKQLSQGRQQIIADFPLNAFNSSTLALLAESNAVRATLSPELTMNQIKELVPRATLPLEAVVHGALPVMVTEHCTMAGLLGGMDIKNRCSKPCRNTGCGLKDRKGVVFPVEVDQFCHQHIFNSKELCLLDDLGILAEAGVSAVRIDARIMDAQRASQVTAAYVQILDLWPNKQWQQAAAAAKEKLERNSEEFTKGHYYRGVV
ncbi:DUF3656 domain-containing U32 family peptidase [Desulfofalx alkaliphila]|uniref:DUF3656 domain-containing U32 family peptidase n=1 Tax=Desulfofalx alkaliphila TaxID=105483 RepID=UPI0004E137E7|nr:DUF3656 domain-containing protein [Desulfofalx alkaliphila]